MIPKLTKEQAAPNGNNLTAELARLNALDFTSDDCLNNLVPGDLRSVRALANKLHEAWESVASALAQMDVSYDNLAAEYGRLKADNKRFFALLVQAEGALVEGLHYTTLAEAYQDESNFRQLAEETLIGMQLVGIGGSDGN